MTALRGEDPGLEAAARVEARHDLGGGAPRRTRRDPEALGDGLVGVALGEQP